MTVRLLDFLKALIPLVSSIFVMYPPTFLHDLMTIYPLQKLDQFSHEYIVSGARRTYSGRLCLGVARSSEIDDSFDVQSLLSGQELEIFSQFKFEARRKEFLLGRLAAKRALCHLNRLTSATAWAVLPNVHGAPVVSCSDIPGLAVHVSISHSSKGAIALASPKLWPATIDLEEIDERNKNVLVEYFSEAELLFIRSHSEHEVLLLMTMLWAIKESLAKLLESGLTAKVSVYETTGWVWKAGSELNVQFLNFGHLQARSVCLGPSVLAMAYPNPSQIHSDKNKLLIDELNSFI